MYGTIRLLAEGFLGITERLDRRFQEETAEPVDLLEARLQTMNNRMKVLEARAERQTEDVLESIRKKFGKTQA